MEKFHISGPFELECGASLPEVQIAYRTYGVLNPDADNVTWICHALTASADADNWWAGLFGPGNIFDPEKQFIVCANILGSCYGTTGPASENPGTGRPYGKEFPLITIQDMVKVHRLLRDHLGIKKVELLIGGSMGGQQALEWAVTEPDFIRNLVVLATNAKHSPWGIAFNEAQRMALEADPTLLENGLPEAGRKGLEAARAVAMLSYRHYQAYSKTQVEPDGDKLSDFRASSYQRYQGSKLYKRFEPLSYISLSRSMDTHNVGRGRGGVEKALSSVKARTLVIGIETDVLFPPNEQEFIAGHVPGANFQVIDSLYGHDGFLVEFTKIAALIRPFLAGKSLKTRTKSGSKAYKSKKRLRNPKALPGSESF
mgnify:CR=1 FL=1